MLRGPAAAAGSERSVYRLTRERKLLLKRRLREAVELQPEIATLRRLLLGLGGVELVAPAAFDSALCLLLGGGAAMAGPVTCMRMFEGACHRNVSRLWLSDSRALVGIGTGYALSADGLWRQHSWGVQRRGILETTSARCAYFGVVLEEIQADSFAESNLA